MPDQLMRPWTDREAAWLLYEKDNLHGLTPAMKVLVKHAFMAGWAFRETIVLEYRV